MSRLDESVSVVLATYNGELYLRDQLRSLASQTLPPAELLVGDDGSTDSTLAIIQDFAKQNLFPVRLFRWTHLGYANNFLRTALMASGSLVAFCDQDDVWHANKLTRIVDTFKASCGVVLVAHHADVIDSEGVSLSRTFPRPTRAGRYEAGSLPFGHYPGFTITVRRWLLHATDPERRPDEGDKRAGLMGHDLWMWMLAACLGESVILPDSLVSYRQHENLFGDLHVTIRERLHRAWVADSENYKGRAARDARRAEYLEGVAREWTGDGHSAWATQAQARAARHRLQASRASERANLYRSPSRRRAALQFAGMLRAGLYVSPDSGVAWRSILKDGFRLPLGYPASNSDDLPMPPS